MRTLIATIATIALGLLLAAPAGASYFINEHSAVHYGRDKLHYGLGYHYTAVVCHPQGLSRPQPGYVYHRWSCAWAAGDSAYNPSCRGSSLVIGSSSSGTYYWRVDYHSGKCPWGWA